MSMPEYAGACRSIQEHAGAFACTCSFMCMFTLTLTSRHLRLCWQGAGKAEVTAMAQGLLALLWWQQQVKRMF